MTDRAAKPPFRPGRGKPFGKPRFSKAGPAARRGAFRDRHHDADGPAILYGWHTVTLALQNPKRRIRKLLLTENAARRLEEEGIKLRLTPEIVRPGQIDALLTPDAVQNLQAAFAHAGAAPDLQPLRDTLRLAKFVVPQPEDYETFHARSAASERYPDAW